jgi:hypothetical protein
VDHRARLAAAFAAAIALAVSVCSACASSSSDRASTSDAALLGEDATDSSDVETQASSLTAAFTLAATADPLHDVDTVVAAAGEARSYFAPAGCLSVATDATSHVVTYALAACFGPWGLARVTGTITATYSLTTATDGSSVLAIDVTGDALHLNRATVSYHATATVTANGLARAMTWSGDLSGTTARGRALQRSANWNATWTVGESCVRLDGSADGEVGSRGFSTTVTDYVRCKGECPQAGGDVAIVEKPSGNAIDIKFGGTNVALVTDGAKTYDVTLACTP